MIQVACGNFKVSYFSFKLTGLKAIHVRVDTTNVGFEAVQVGPETSNLGFKIIYGSLEVARRVWLASRRCGGNDDCPFETCCFSSQRNMVKGKKNNNDEEEATKSVQLLLRGQRRPFHALRLSSKNCCCLTGAPRRTPTPERFPATTSAISQGLPESRVNGSYSLNPVYPLRG